MFGALLITSCEAKKTGGIKTEGERVRDRVTWGGGYCVGFGEPRGDESYFARVWDFVKHRHVECWGRKDPGEDDSIKARANGRGRWVRT